MSEDKAELLDEDQEAQLLQALAAQAPAEEYVATAGEPLPEGALVASGDDIVRGNSPQSVCQYTSACVPQFLPGRYTYDRALRPLAACRDQCGAHD